MKTRPLLLVATLLIAVAIAIYKIDWGFNALLFYMAASQPLEVGESPRLESAGTVNFTATALTDQLKMPWSFAFMPGGDILVTERGGTLQRFDPESGTLTPVSGIPEVYYKGQGGLLDVALHPDFPEPAWIYLTYSAPMDEDRSTTRLVRALLRGDALHQLEVLYTIEPVRVRRSIATVIAIPRG